MLRNHFSRLFLIATTIVLSSIGRADNHINPDGRGKMAKIGQERLNNYIMQRLDYLLEQVGQSLGQRYNLDQTIRQLLINLNDRSSNRSRPS